jgi:tripartite ATP-independent transporter DctP family solute receptor
MKRISAVLALVVLAVIVLSCGANEAAAGTPYRIKFALPSAELSRDTNVETAWAYTMKEYIEKESRGQIRVDLYFASQLGSQAEVVQGASSGAIEYGIINVATFQNFKKETMAFSIPGLFTSADEVNKVLDGDWMRDFYRQMTDQIGVMVTHQFTNGFRNFTNSRKVMKMPQDARGMVFRVMDSPVSMRMVEALGARPVPIPSSEMYVAMQNRVVDGHENSLAAIVQDRSYEVQKYLTMDGHLASIVAGIMSKKFYDSLPADLQKVVIAGAGAGRDEARRIMKTFNERALVLLREKGMDIYQPTPDELKMWHDTMRSAAVGYVQSQIGPKTIEDLMAAIKSVRQ